MAEENSFHVGRVLMDPPPEKDQLGFFHSTFYEIHIYLITKKCRLVTDGKVFLDLMLNKQDNPSRSKACKSLMPDQPGPPRGWYD